MEGKSLVSRVIDGVKTLFKKDIACEDRTWKVQKEAQKSIRILSFENAKIPQSALKEIMRQPIGDDTLSYLTANYDKVEIGCFSK